MLINGEKIINTGRRVLSFFDYHDYTVFYGGFVYIPGIMCGEPSLRKFIDDGALECLEKTCLTLYGNYLVVFQNKTTGVLSFFCDHNGMSRLYTNGTLFSNSFLDLCDASNATASSLDKRALAEFILLGALRESTLIAGITRVMPDKIVQIIGGKIRFFTKSLPPIDEPSQLNLEQFFHQLAMSLPKEDLGVDLTGGTDSRLISSAMHAEGLSFLTCAFGRSGIRDIEVSRKVAECLKKPWFAYEHNDSGITDETLSELFEVCDGTASMILMHIVYANAKVLKEKGVAVKLKGIAGELYKDEWWQHEMPFYRSSKSDIDKLYALRMNSLRPNKSCYTPNFYNDMLTFEKGFRSYLQGFIKEWNTKTYDNIFYRYIVFAPASSYNIVESEYLASYAPLCEYDLVRWSFSLPRNSRTQYKLHRQAITKYSPEAAKQKTVAGQTCYDSALSLISDQIKFFIRGLKRLATLILRKTLNKTFFIELPSIDITQSIKTLPTYQRAMDCVCKAEILSSPDAALKESKEMRSRLFTVGMLIMYLSENTTKET